MAVVQLPNIPQARTTTYSLASNAVDQTPTFGGPTQRIARLGDKWSMTFDSRPLYYPQAASLLLTALLQGLSGKVRAYIPQPGVNTNAGTAITFANAAAAAGTTVAMTGFNHGFPVAAGQFFNVSTNGVEYLYQTTANATADGNGNCTLTFLPMLKAPPNSGDQITFNAPVIEGFVQGNQQSWTLSLVQSVGVTFNVKEAQ